MVTRSTLDSQIPSLCSLGRYESNLSIYSQEKLKKETLTCCSHGLAAGGGAAWCSPGLAAGGGAAGAEPCGAWEQQLDTCSCLCNCFIGRRRINTLQT